MLLDAFGLGRIERVRCTYFAMYGTSASTVPIRLKLIYLSLEIQLS
jgi:hypothetical protein